MIENQIWSPSIVGRIAGQHLPLFALNGTDVRSRQNKHSSARPRCSRESSAKSIDLAASGWRKACETLTWVKVMQAL